MKETKEEMAENNENENGTEARLARLDEEKDWTVTELAEALAISESRVWSLIRAGKITRVGRAVYRPSASSPKVTRLGHAQPMLNTTEDEAIADALLALDRLLVVTGLNRALDGQVVIELADEMGRRITASMGSGSTDAA